MPALRYANNVYKARNIKYSRCDSRIPCFILFTTLQELVELDCIRATAAAFEV
jgi:hypothetical protein